MKVYVVILDDIEQGSPEAVFSTKEAAVLFADTTASKYCDYEVLEYDLDTESFYTQVYSTSKRFKERQKNIEELNKLLARSN